MWIWPITKFWTFNPFQWVIAVIWNISELTRIPLPKGFDTWSFGVIMGGKNKKVEEYKL